MCSCSRASARRFSRRSHSPYSSGEGTYGVRRRRCQAVKRGELLFAGEHHLGSGKGGDAITSGLRRTLDALRAVLERTRGDNRY